MDFDGALNKSGGFGRFQKILALVFLTTATAHFTCNHMAQVFLLIVPEHYWCPLVVSNGNGSFEGLSGVGNDTPVYVRQSCLLEFGSGTSDRNGTTTDYCEGGWYYEYNDLYPTMSTENNWVCGDAWKQYVLHTTFWIGSMSGYVTSGFLADKFGRKVAICVLATISALANLIPLFINQHLGLAIARLVAGMGAESVCSTIFVLVMEFTIPERRTLIGFVWAFSWTLMASAYPWYADLIQSWRGLVITNSALSAVILVLLWFVPESPSWHLTAGRRDKAVAILTKIARVNGLRDISEDDFKALQVGLGEEQKHLA
ncbi:putative sugar transporter [Ixodes scapularis]